MSDNTYNETVGESAEPIITEDVNWNPLKGNPVGVATQSAHPWRATFRTVVAALVSFAVMLPVILPALQTWATEHADILPEWVPAVVAATGAGVAAAAGLVTRLLSVPGFEQWMRTYLPFLAAAPKAE